MDKSVSLVLTAPVRSSKRVSGGKGVKWGNSEQSIIFGIQQKSSTANEFQSRPDHADVLITSSTLRASMDAKGLTCMRIVVSAMSSELIEWCRQTLGSMCGEEGFRKKDCYFSLTPRLFS